MGFLVWIVSFILTLVVPLLFGFAYLILKMLRTRQAPTEEILTQDLSLILISIGAILPAHLLILIICWLVVTSSGKRPFLQSISWGHVSWRDWLYVIALVVIMTAAAITFEKFLPHRETSLEKFLKLGYSVRLLVAVMAVLSAPLVEEIVYRGVLYAGIERDWGKGAAVVLVTFMFALVHAQQYWGSYAALTAIFTLSLALTLLRALTGKLAPCVLAHLLYNGIQAVALLLQQDNTANNQ